MSNRIGYEPQTTPMQAVSSSAALLFDNAFELAELQLKMARCDLRVFGRQAMHVVWIIPTALGLLLAGLPVLGFAIAGTIVATTDLSMTTAQWIVGAVFVVIALALALLGAFISIRAVKSFRRSQRELEKNVRWLRQMVVGPNPQDYPVQGSLDPTYQDL